MKVKKLDLAGRLDRSGGGGEEAGEAQRQKLNYGRQRLGITSDSPEQAPQEEKTLAEDDRPFELPPSPTPPRALAALAQATSRTDSVPAGQAAASLSSPVSVARPGSGPTFAVSTEPKDRWTQAVAIVKGNKRIAAGVGVCLVLGGVLLLRWVGASPKAAPAIAGASGSAAQMRVTDHRSVKPAGAEAQLRNPQRGPSDASKTARPQTLNNPVLSSVPSLGFRISDLLPSFKSAPKQAKADASAAPVSVNPIPSDTSNAGAQLVAVPRFRECPPGIRLSGIIHCPDGAYASINNRLLKVGGTIGGAKVTGITDFSVEMEIDGERFIVGIGADEPSPDQSEEIAKPVQPEEQAEADAKPASTPKEPPAEQPKAKRKRGFAVSQPAGSE